MRLIPASLLLSLALAACERPPAEPRVTIEEARVTLPVLPGRPGAAYFKLRTNHPSTRLVRVSSPSAERIELHESRASGGVSRMRPAEDLTFDGTLEFQPGGKHAMLFGIDPALKPGATIPLTFTFDPAPPVTVEAKVLGPGGGNHLRH